jgi:peptidoglycan/LPS O-acetylase OafA/YrhL
MFFVISGFVITAMLYREWSATGKIRFGRFYIRRFKRLMPALALMIAVTIPISLFLLSPLGPQQNAAKTGIGAMFLEANNVIAGTTGGYFDAPAASNPLLHTWSLSVEEQFYIVFPLLLLSGWLLARQVQRSRGGPDRRPRPSLGVRRGADRVQFRRAALLTVGVVGAVSLGLAFLGVAGYKGQLPSWLFGFYSPLTRAWEFAAGAILAIVVARRTLTSLRLAVGLGLLGATMLGVSVRFFTGATPFPGPWTLVPVVGTLLLLLIGTYESNPITRALSVRPLTKVGDLSYSIYLWHWPLIVFGAALWPDNPRVLLAAAALSFVPAVVSYHYVEQPIRNLEGLNSERFTRLVAVVVTPALALSAFGLLTAGQLYTPPSAYQGVIGWGDIGYLADHYYPCGSAALRRMTQQGPGIRPRCQQSKPGQAVQLAIVGDSHAEQLFRGLADSLPSVNVMYYLADGFPVRTNPQFTATYDWLGHNPTVSLVVVNAFWASRGVPVSRFSASLKSLQANGKRVVLTDDVPYFPFDPYACKFRGVCSQDVGTFRENYAKYDRSLLATVKRVPGVEILKTAGYFCGGSTCTMTRGNQVLYRDSNHINFMGSKYLAGRILRDHAYLIQAIPDIAPSSSALH